MTQPTNVTNTIETIPEVIKETKAGYKTTEFWLTAATSVLVLLNTIPLPTKYEGVVVAALSGVYAISRGIAKHGVPEAFTSQPLAGSDEPDERGSVSITE